MKKRILSVFFAALTLICAAIPCSAAGNSRDCVELPIVMYHHISPKAKLLGKYVISPEQFESDLKYLQSNGYTAIGTEQLRAWCRGEGELPDKPVMITFDDGYESTAVYALPLLEEYGMTAVVAVIGSVAQQYSDTPDHMLDYSHMSWEAAADIDKNSIVEVQCHTYDMHKLSPRKGCGKKYGESLELYRCALEADLERFQESFAQRTGHSSTAIALPFGCYCSDTLDILAESGFDMVFTCSEKINRLTGDPAELMELGRFNRPSGISSEAFFEKWQ